jgi:hypothetical protein
MHLLTGVLFQLFFKLLGMILLTWLHRLIFILLGLNLFNVNERVEKGFEVKKKKQKAKWELNKTLRYTSCKVSLGQSSCCTKWQDVNGLMQSLSHNWT